MGEMRLIAPFSGGWCVEMRQFQRVLRFNASGTAHHKGLRLCINRDQRLGPLYLMSVLAVRQPRARRSCSGA
jgi:hypothetical protein